MLIHRLQIYKCIYNIHVKTSNNTHTHPTATQTSNCFTHFFPTIKKFNKVKKIKRGKRTKKNFLSDEFTKNSYYPKTNRNRSLDLPKPAWLTKTSCFTNVLFPNNYYKQRNYKLSLIKNQNGKRKIYAAQKQTFVSCCCT